MNIPSNFTLKERVKYYSFDQKTSELIEEAIDKVDSLEKEIEVLDARCERYYEQMQFCKDFIEEAMKELSKPKLKSEFIETRKWIETLLENSYVEL